jgi:curved DNA-binding protein CbpA
VTDRQHPDWIAKVKELAHQLDELDYFQVLGLTPSCTLPAIKARYHEMQKIYHPDTVFNTPDEELRAAVHRVAKRVAEAYVVLRDPRKRGKYTADISSESRSERLRYTESSENELRLVQRDAEGKTEQGKQLWRKAKQSMERGDLQSALRDLKTAMIFEQGNEQFQQKLKEIQEKLATTESPKT